MKKKRDLDGNFQQYNTSEGKHNRKPVVNISSLEVEKTLYISIFSGFNKMHLERLEEKRKSSMITIDKKLYK